MKLFLTMRGRLTAWYLSTVFFVSAVLLVVWTLAVDAMMMRQIDHHLHLVVVEASQVIIRSSPTESIEAIRRIVGHQGMTITLLSADGTPLVQTNSPDIALVSEHYIQQVMATQALDSVDPVHFSSSGVRFATSRINTPSGPVILAVGYSLDIVSSTIRRMLAVTVLVVTLLLPILLVAGWRWLSHFFVREKEFLADTAHTLKTPVAVARAYISELPGPRLQKNKVISALDEANRTISDLLLASTASVSTPQPSVSLSQIVSDLSELAEVLGKQKRLKIESNISPNIQARLHRPTITRALSNLVENAVKYSPKGGKILIKLTPESSRTRLTISNQGQPIDRRDLPHIFQRFFRGRNSSDMKGSGLGLAVSKEIIEAQGGRIHIKSGPKIGTRVVVEL